ncbi:MAG TPA: glycoside hydrolase family 36 protein [Bryobacteraceae bacterium]|nr:glycoside hydrolase family 36 protein [Bryobacteraceae bacterium]
MRTRRREFVLGACGIAGIGKIEAAGATRKLNLGNADIEFSLQARTGEPLQLTSLRNRGAGFNWAGAGKPGADQKVTVSKQINRSEFQVDYDVKSGLSQSQRFRLAADLPVFECFGEFRNATAQSVPKVTELDCIQIPLRADLGPLQVHCVSRDTYMVQRLPVGDTLVLEGGGWNSPKYCGLLVLEAMDSRQLLFTGIQWERGWRYQLKRTGGVILLELVLGDFESTVAAGESLAAPTVFFGVGAGDPDNAFRLAQRYLGTLAPKALANWPWVAYDIWGTEISGVEQAILSEVEAAHDLGVELFYIDASWYKGSSKKGTGDWGCGLGNYEEDREKFPRGLANISDAVHARGMKFGLWIGPNIVDSRLIGNTVPREWIAQLDGKDRVLTIREWESPCHQVCLGSTAYVTFLKQTLPKLVREFRLDWLKWDNSGIPGIPGKCNRPDHGHQAGDGSYRALLGQYEVYRHLHREFPDLVLEQCGYGSRMDYGLIDTIRANWLSDASFPSKHVRQNALAGSYVFPNSYNGAWIVKDPEIDKTTDPDVLDSIYRSRMMGLFGFGTLTGKLSERVSLYSKPVLEAARRNIPVYKKYRHLLHEDVYHLFPPAGSPEGWQAVQFANRDGSESVIFCFRSGSPQTSIRLSVNALRPSSQYTITNAKNEVKTVQGSQLLREGLIVSLNKPEMSDVIFVKTTTSAQPGGRARSARETPRSG